MALTPESIATTWSGGGTVQIATPDDYVIFVNYLVSNPTAESMRNAEIMTDLNFSETDFTFFPYVGSGYSNITLDGNSHSIKNVVRKGLTSSSYLFANTGASSSTLFLKNIKFENFYVTATNIILFARNTLQNVQIKNCRFVANDYYIGASDCKLENYSSAATIRVGSNYLAASLVSGSQRIAILDTASRTTQGGQAQVVTNAFSDTKQIFTRNRFSNFATVFGIQGGGSGRTISQMSYAAITAENATTVYPLWSIYGREGNPQNYATYYDNTLVPAAAAHIAAGLPTTTLKNVAEMQQAGFDVEAV